ncbi:PAS domain-containing sensor histidine kinase [Maridesulfovibrio frigidus]|uniref:PAS domain-containing sensor histidine kinase n=1 Tax=Maridesulfovibrio frigidus TaxID=340956 RepID=UPI00068C52C3|nr:PAS domain S-box protein [Maridesulfovibrio frigidus]
MTTRSEFSGKDMLAVFAFIAACLWMSDAIVEFLWFNSHGKTFFSFFLPIDEPHELFIRVMFTCVLVLSGSFGSLMYAKLERSEEHARQSEKNLSTTFDSIGEAVISTDSDGYVVRMNPVAERMTGWPFADAEGLCFADVVKVVDSKTRAVCTSPIEGVILRKESQSFPRNAVLVSRNGQEYEIADSASPIIDDDGEVAGVVLVFRDLTERNSQESELSKLRNYLSSIVDSMPSVLVGVDGDGNVTLWNKMAAKVTGLSAEVVQGKMLIQVFPQMEDDMQGILESIKSKTTRREQRKMRHSVTGVCYEDVTIYPLIANGVEGAVILIDDVTELIKMEQAMIQNEKMMSIGGLAAGMAHEINNPLAAILGHAQNINNRVFGELEKNKTVASECEVSLNKVREYLEKRDVPRMLDGIYSSSNRAAKIIGNMARFSHKEDDNFGKHNLASMLDETLELATNDYDFKRHYDFRKIEIVREYDAEVPEVYCESSDIQQVFFNLLKNGAQYMVMKDYRGAHPKFVLRVRREENMAVVEVEDNGPGMDEDVLKRIFEPFYSTKKLGQGSGLGLSVSYFVIADQHKGIMEAHSKPGSWARFIVKLPIGDSPQLQEAVSDECVKVA